MIPPLIDPLAPTTIDHPHPLIIREQASFALGEYQVEILSYLGLLTTGVHHFQVKIQDLANIDILPASGTERLGLLRVGSIDDGLSRELQIRQALDGYGLIAPLLAHQQVDFVEINSPLIPVIEDQGVCADPVADEPLQTIDEPIQPIDETSSEVFLQSNVEIPQSIDAEQKKDDNSTEVPDSEGYLAESAVLADDHLSISEDISAVCDSPVTAEPDYLEEEIYPEEEANKNATLEKLLLLTDFPCEALTLERWLENEHSQAEDIALVIQLCQLFSHIAKQKWCVIDISPKFIEVSKPLKIFDLSNVHLADERLCAGIIGDYCAPELSSSPTINELMSSYAIGALFYQLIHHKLPKLDHNLSLEIQPIPRIYQLLKISLSPDPQERFPIGQFLNLLIELRNSLRIPHVQWNIASRSTLGLSINRLQNEDSYGVRQQQLSNAETFLLGVVADGMGGMAQGDEASKIAVEVLLGASFPKDCKTVEQRNGWLLDLFQQANLAISEVVRGGGTTLSAVLAIDSELFLAHVGDSRVYLLRNGEIQQISEDHSLVAMKVANGEITEEESLTHAERNVLLKSLGSKRSLSAGYVQNLARTVGSPSMTLEHGDILLLCSDGVWDLVSKQEFQEVFVGAENLQAGVDKTIQLVIDRGASDNSTLLALNFLNTSHF
jgi:PPM family protein phosphatase